MHTILQERCSYIADQPQTPPSTQHKQKEVQKEKKESKKTRNQKTRFQETLTPHMKVIFWWWA